MKRRNFIKSTAAGASAMLLTGTSNMVNAAPAQSEEITHYVLFWLKEGLSEQEITDFASFFELLREIPVVQSLRYGRPAKTNQREVVDNSFTYNLLATFKNLADINVYETHPIHLDAIQKYSHYWYKVVVHDSCL
ncbi:Dabb family protein [Olivibacter sitiensis]|uniref:Dabb family protein n=1 Tax=Olivibacter sitiensis TaxID=376470 RepID=UPI00040DDAA3|nr:Dabb family protein [Olivibacter sitiensis]